jgi:EpsI family protein
MKRHHLLILVGVLVLQSVIYYGFAQHEVIPQTPPWSDFPTQVGRWTLANELPPDEASMAILQPDDYLSRLYVADDGNAAEAGRKHSANASRVELFVAYFKTQRTGHAPHSPKACLPGAGWKPVSSAVIPISVPSSGVTINANQYIVRRDGDEMAVFYWYQNSHHTIANEYMFQVYAIPELLSHGRTDVAIIRVITPMLNGSLDNARNTAVDFIHQIFPEVKSHIPSA